MNCKKLRLSLLAVGICFCLILILDVEAQLNFSTGWGKRSNSDVSGPNARSGPRGAPIPRTFSTYYRQLMKTDSKERRLIN